VYTQPAQATRPVDIENPAGHIGVIGKPVYYISGVGEGSPAELSGVKKNDLIYFINGKQIFHADDFRLPIAQNPPGTSFNLRYLRYSAEKGQFEPADISVKSEPFRQYQYQ